MFTSFEITPLIGHGRRPRIQKMKCLAQKLTKWRRIEKLWQKRENEIFSKIERFALCKSCYRPSTKWLSFCPGGSDFTETCLYGFVFTNGKKSRKRNYGIFEPWADSLGTLSLSYCITWTQLVESTLLNMIKTADGQLGPFIWPYCCLKTAQSLQ